MFVAVMTAPERHVAAGLHDPPVRPGLAMAVVKCLCTVCDSDHCLWLLRCLQGKRSNGTGSNGQAADHRADIFAEQDELFGVGDMDAMLMDDPLGDMDLAPPPEPASPDQNNTASNQNNAGGSANRSCSAPMYSVLNATLPHGALDFGAARSLHRPRAAF
jgi:hypothetical protein